MPATVATIVASGSFVSFTGNLSATTIFTPAVSGLYEFHYYQESASGTYAVPSLAWTDDGGEQTLGFNTQLFNEKAGPVSFTLRLAADTSLSLSTTGARDTDVTNIYYAIESLA